MGRNSTRDSGLVGSAKVMGQNLPFMVRKFTKGNGPKTIVTASVFRTEWIPKLSGMKVIGLAENGMG
jgi:peroxiredoxin